MTSKTKEESEGKKLQIGMIFISEGIEFLGEKNKRKRNKDNKKKGRGG